MPGAIYLPTPPRFRGLRGGEIPDHDIGMESRSETAEASRLPPLQRSTLQRYARELRERFGSRLLAVRAFGSYARGEANEASDFDVFVLIDRLTAAATREAIHIATGIEADHHYRLRLSPLVLDRALHDEWRRQERRLVLDIEREGIPA